MLPDDGAAGRRERARRGPQTPADVAGSSDQPGGSTGCRPTAAELAEALAVIRQMKAATPPILLGRGQPPKPNVVACAIAMQRGELFESEAAALQRFGVLQLAPKTPVRQEWVDDVCRAPGGLSVGPSGTHPC